MYVDVGAQLIEVMSKSMEKKQALKWFIMALLVILMAWYATTTFKRNSKGNTPFQYSLSASSGSSDTTTSDKLQIGITPVLKVASSESSRDNNLNGELKQSTQQLDNSEFIKVPTIHSKLGTKVHQSPTAKSESRKLPQIIKLKLYDRLRNEDQKNQMIHHLKMRVNTLSAVTALSNQSDSSHEVRPNHCRNSLCSEYLTKVDKVNYDQCTRSSRGKKNVSEINGPCRFMDGRNRASVGLVSFPGSGNTWLRSVLESATGICTGAGYCDPEIRSRGFNGERVTSGAVLVVKTHNVPRRWTTMDHPVLETVTEQKHRYYDYTPTFGAQIVIVRNPLHALIAEWNRRLGVIHKKESHVFNASPNEFKNSSEWSKFVTKGMAHWRSILNSVVQAYKGNHSILVIRYEDMKRDLIKETTTILSFLNMSVPQNKLDAILSKQFGTFRRKHHDHLQLFTPYQMEFVKNRTLNAFSYLKKSLNQTLGIEEYLDEKAVQPNNRDT